jgi:predicted dehydrogenase
MSLVASVVGTGKIGEKHAKILSAMPTVELGPLVDVDRDRANEVATRVGTTTGSVADAVSAADCLFVCTPDDQHTEIALRAIEGGLHTFVEKPLAATAAETERLTAAARESDAIHTVGHVLRFDPRYRSIRDAVRTGEIGTVVSVTMERLVKRSRARRTGGESPPWMRLGVHDFDLVEWLFDTEIVRLAAAEAAGALATEGYDIDESVSLLAKLSDEGTATFTLGFSLPDGHPGSIVRTVAAGTDGTVSVDASGTEVQRWNEDSGSAVDTHLWPDISGVPRGALERQDHEFIRAIRSNTSAPVPFADGHRAVRIAETVGDAVDSRGHIGVGDPGPRDL